MRCPASVDLVRNAFADPVSSVEHRVAAHVRRCPSCLGRIRTLRETVSALRSDPWGELAASPSCLTEGEIAAVSEGVAVQEHERWVAHLAECAACRGRFAELTRILRDPVVAAEVERLEGDLGYAAPLQRRRYLTVAAGLAAAALAGVLLRPAAVPPPAAPDEAVSSAHRESAITTTVAPRILGPDGTASHVDSLVWTRVPNAARYRLRIFDLEGTLVWDVQTSDTALPIAAHLRGDTATTYLWKVEARTGWDRWASSDWRDLVIRPEPDAR
jgi:hypothetical protein